MTHFRRDWLYGLICVFCRHYTLLLELGGRDPSLTDRTLIWELLGPLIDDRFLKGYGFGAFWSSADASGFIKRWGYIGNAHSGYVETLLNGGLIQLIALILLFAQTLTKHYRAITAEHSARYHACALVIIGLFAVTNYVAYVIPNYRSAEFLCSAPRPAFRHHRVNRTAPLPRAMPTLPRATVRGPRILIMLNSSVPTSGSVCVIIPMYNAAASIGPALDSLSLQTRRPDKVIVIDDGSSDEGPQIVTDYVAPFELILLQQTNQGPAAARNRGVFSATERFIAFLEPMIMEPEKLHKQLALYDNSRVKGVR